jgi:hypothetical protein
MGFGRPGGAVEQDRADPRGATSLDVDLKRVTDEDRSGRGALNGGERGLEDPRVRL